MIGNEIIDHDPMLTGQGMVKQSYTIIEVYPYYVRAMRVTDNGTELYKCFNLGDLVTRGMIKGESLPTKQGCRHYWRYEE